MKIHLTISEAGLSGLSIAASNHVLEEKDLTIADALDLVSRIFATHRSSHATIQYFHSAGAGISARKYFGKRPGSYRSLGYGFYYKFKPTSEIEPDEQREFLRFVEMIGAFAWAYPELCSREVETKLDRAHASAGLGQAI